MCIKKSMGIILIAFMIIIDGFVIAGSSQQNIGDINFKAADYINQNIIIKRNITNPIDCRNSWIQFDDVDNSNLTINKTMSGN